MPIYSDIEITRYAGNPHYVDYFFNRIDPSYPEMFFIDQPYCVFVETDSARYSNIIRERQNHTVTSDAYLRLVSALQRRGCGGKVMDEFKRLTTVGNSSEEKTCAFMLYSGGSVNFDNLIRDISNNNSNISYILDNLALQVNCGALNGAFCYVMGRAYMADGDVDAFYKYIQRAFYTLAYGTTANPHAVDIPGAYNVFRLPQLLCDSVKSVAESGADKVSDIDASVKKFFQKLGYVM